MSMDHRDHKAVAEQVERLARSYHRRFQRSFGASLTVEDLEQEFWIVWVRVRDKFDPERGYDFRALLGVSIKNQAIKLAKFHGARVSLTPVSLNNNAGDEGTNQILDMVPALDPSVESEMIRRQTAQLRLAQMDERLRQMVEFLSDTPEELKKEVEASIAKAELGASMGARTTPPKRLTLTMLTEIYGLSRCSRYRLIDDFKEIMDRD